MTYVIWQHSTLHTLAHCIVISVTQFTSGFKTGTNDGLPSESLFDPTSTPTRPVWTVSLDAPVVASGITKSPPGACNTVARSASVHQCLTLTSTDIAAVLNELGARAGWWLWTQRWCGCLISIRKHLLLSQPHKHSGYSSTAQRRL